MRRGGTGGGGLGGSDVAQTSCSYADTSNTILEFALHTAQAAVGCAEPYQLVLYRLGARRLTIIRTH